MVNGNTARVFFVWSFIIVFYRTRAIYVIYCNIMGYNVITVIGYNIIISIGKRYFHIRAF